MVGPLNCRMLHNPLRASLEHRGTSNNVKASLVKTAGAGVYGEEDIRFRSNGQTEPTTESDH